MIVSLSQQDREYAEKWDELHPAEPMNWRPSDDRDERNEPIGYEDEDE